MFQFSLVTPEKKVVENIDISEVIVPAHRGELNILKGHSPLMSTLGTGVLKFKRSGEGAYECAAISWGYLEVGPTGVTVLAETAETGDAVDKQRAEDALEKAKSELKKPGLGADQIEKLQFKMKKAEARIALAEQD
ncbi:MAG: ATP synthase F1 subunit epsilon [Bdellovibrionales bacterium]|nr:ATP synthase F1 subunit epsilon [Bdellovibrionales bacterium]